MDREKILKILKEYLSRTGPGSLLINRNEKTVEWVQESTVTNETYLVIISCETNSKCRCKTYFSEDCNACNHYLYYLLEQTEIALEEVVEEEREKVAL